MGQKFGHPIPAEVVQATGLRDGERVEVLQLAGEVVIRRLTPVLTLEDMFRDGAMAALLYRRL